MADNPNANKNAAGNKRKTPKQSFFRMRNRFNTKRDTGPRSNAVSMVISSDGSLSSSSTSVGQNSQSSSSGYGSENSTPPRSRRKEDGYSGWHLYFPETKYEEESPLVRKIQAFEQHIKSQSLFYKLNEIREKFWFNLPLARLKNDDFFQKQYPSFLDDLNVSTFETLSCAGLAAHQLIVTETPPIQDSQNTDNLTKLSLLPIRARIQGYTPIVNLTQLKQDIYNYIISVRGTVVRVNPPELSSSWITFKCSTCKTEQAVRQTEPSKSSSPSSCKGTNCRTRSNFRMIHKSPFTQTESYQTIRLQESVQAVKGQIPKTIEVDLAHDLVDTVYPGDDITVTGVINIRKNERNNTFQRGARGSEAGIHMFYINGISITSNQNTMAVRNLDFNDKELSVIEKVRHESNLFKLLTHSLCSRIFGHEMVKAGLILSLFGGSGNGAIGGKKPGVGKRSEIHILIVGDPGLGKSLMIQSCANISPRGIFVCGNSTSNAGLTASIRHDKSSDGSLEAGALVLSDQGICCIDEFDKMKANYQSLLQVMEQQTVSVAKAGVLCALPARTTIIAAANPAEGHYNKDKTVSENLKIWPTLLSRFDLVFILLDQADAHLDNLLTAHIQALKENHFEPRVESVRSSLSSTQLPGFSSANQQQLTPEHPDDPLYIRLKLSNHTDFQPLPVDILRKYILYARKFCFPTISKEACIELKKFYSEMRITRPGIESVSVTTRQLEALIRMTQARARLELAKEATVEHAQDVLAILRYTMVDVLSTGKGTLKVNRSFNGTGVSRATKVKRFLAAIQGEMKTVWTTDELKEIAQNMGFANNYHEIIDSLNVQGFLIKRGSGVYRLNN